VAHATAKSLEKLAADRFESAAKFAEALTNPAFTWQTTQAGAAGAPSIAMSNRNTVGVGVVAAVAIAAALWGWLRPLPQAPRSASRYSIALPEDQELAATFNGSRVAVSPDGSRLVYPGVGAAGRTVRDDPNAPLLVRDLDQLHATPIPGTEGGGRPFFSPDGSQIGFHDQGAWRMVALTGGGAITLGDSDLGWRGASWGSDGYIYFDGAGPGMAGLARVAEGGGPPEAVTSVDTTRREVWHGWPEALPGGRGVVFTVGRGGTRDFDEWDIAVADLSTGTHTVVVPGARARFASGYLFYVTGDGTLMAAPFDETALALTGEAVAVGESLEIGHMGGADLAVSETGKLFYTKGDLNRRNVAEIVWVTRDGTAEEIDQGWAGSMQDPVLSPDGTQLAVSFVSLRVNGSSNIWIKELDRGPGERPLTFDATAFHPAWTPDGQAVVYLSCCGQGGLELKLRRADGSGRAELRLSDVSTGKVTYSPDGQWLTYGNRQDLYALRVGGDSGPVPLLVTEGIRETAQAVSPDGRWLAYVSDESGRDEVYVIPFPNTDGGKWRVSTDGGQQPVWADSGRELFYVSEDSLMGVQVLPGTTFAVGERRALFSIDGYRTDRHPQYDVTPDNQRFLMIRYRSGSGLETELIVVENVFEELKARVGR
jgi:serine/threonine-protein kinase